MRLIFNVIAKKVSHSFYPWALFCYYETWSMMNLCLFSYASNYPNNFESLSSILFTNWYACVCVLYACYTKIWFSRTWFSYCFWIHFNWNSRNALPWDVPMHINQNRKQSCYLIFEAWFSCFSDRKKKLKWIQKKTLFTKKKTWNNQIEQKKNKCTKYALKLEAYGNWIGHW